jgi:hypothetical protein
MGASLPKKLKRIRIIIILSRYIDTDLESSVTDTNKEALLAQMAAVQPQLQIPDQFWSKQQNNFWNCIAMVYTGLGGDDYLNAPPPDEPTVGTWVSEMAPLIALLP